MPLNADLVPVIFQGIQTSNAKKLYSFVIFQEGGGGGGGVPNPLLPFWIRCWT